MEEARTRRAETLAMKDPANEDAIVSRTASKAVEQTFDAPISVPQNDFVPVTLSRKSRPRSTRFPELSAENKDEKPRSMFGWLRRTQ